MAISNDKDFKNLLGSLDPLRQRRVAARFVERVLDLSGDVRVRAAVEAAGRGELTEAEREVLFQAVNSARVESYTQCGKECDWAEQAGHFVAKAALNCVKAAVSGENIAWDAAMHARMAHTCQSVASGVGTETREAEAQYAILDEILKA